MKLGRSVHIHMRRKSCNVDIMFILLNSYYDIAPAVANKQTRLTTCLVVSGSASWSCRGDLDDTTSSILIGHTTREIAGF